MSPTWWQTLQSARPLVIDGGTGSELRRRGVRLDATVWSGLAALTHYDVLREIHADYARAGARVITANTFATNRFLLAALGRERDVATAIRRSVEAAMEARAACGLAVAIAGSISCLPPRFEIDAYPDLRTEHAAYVELAESLAAARVDLIALEMLQDDLHAALACRAVAATKLPFWLGVSCRIGPNGELVGYDRTDVGFVDMLEALLPYRPTAVCIMHSPVDATLRGLPVVAERFGGFIGAYPEWPLGADALEESSDRFADVALELYAHGAQIVGGCCGTTPAHIRAAAEALEAGARRAHGPSST